MINTEIIDISKIKRPVASWHFRDGLYYLNIFYPGKNVDTWSYSVNDSGVIVDCYFIEGDTFALVKGFQRSFKKNLIAWQYI